MVDASQGLSLRISLTSRCQFRCVYCVPPGGQAAVRESILSRAQVVRFVQIVKKAFGLIKVHLTGGEPLLRRDVIDMVGDLADMDVGDLALTTNGQHLADLAIPLREAGLGRVNVSLDSLEERTYAAITRGGRVTAALQGIAQARTAGLRVKLNTVVLHRVNDAEVVAIARWGLDHGCEVRFLELMPIGPAAGIFEAEYVSSAQVRERLLDAFELRPLSGQSAGTARRFQARDAEGRDGVVAFISADSEPFCRGCRRLRLTSSGRLIGCLALGEGPDIGSLLGPENDGEEHRLIEAIRGALGRKRAHLAFPTKTAMIQTGG